MKGITHFVSGVAAATFFRPAVEMAQTEASWIIVLGGICGLLPDTLDFKFYRFFSWNTYVVDPDPRRPDPQKIAETLARAIEEAHETNREIRVQLHTMRLGVNLWRRYTLTFDQLNNQVLAEIGPVVDTSQIPYAGTEPQENARAAIPIRRGQIYQAYKRPSVIDIMSGPSLGFVRKGERVEMIFLPWHRQWSHSLTMGIYLGILGWVVMMFWVGWKRSLIYGLVIATAFNTHVVEDLTGFMGGNLFWPFSKSRSRGLGLVKATNPMVNFIVIWTALLMILFNLNRFAKTPVFQTPWYLYYLFALVIPGTGLILIARWLRKGAGEPLSIDAEKEKEQREEAEED